MMEIISITDSEVWLEKLQKSSIILKAQMKNVLAFQHKKY